MARCERGLGNTEAAARTIDGLLAGEPNNADYLFNRGCIELDAGRPQQALPHLRKSAERAPFLPDVLTNLAICLEQAGLGAEAKTVRDRAARVDADLQEIDKVTTEVRSAPSIRSRATRPA